MLTECYKSQPRYLVLILTGSEPEVNWSQGQFQDQGQ